MGRQIQLKHKLRSMSSDKRTSVMMRRGDKKVKISLPSIEAYTEESFSTNKTQDNKNNQVVVFCYLNPKLKHARILISIRYLYIQYLNQVRGVASCAPPL